MSDKLNETKVVKLTEASADEKKLTEASADEKKAEAKRLKEWEELEDRIRQPCKTDLLDNLKFSTPKDRYVWDRLPLTNYEKEEMLLSMGGSNSIAASS